MTNNNPGLHEALNLLLADSFAVYLKTKSFHWHVSGPHFREYHLLFDEQASQILDTTDRIAERVRKTGGTTLRSIGHVARLQRVSDADAHDLDAEAMLMSLYQDNSALLGALRDVKGSADEAGDHATSGLIDELTDGAEERVWFLAQSLQSGSKSTSLPF